jgi:hypothetical protein
MQVILGDKMDKWNGHPAGEQVGLEQGMTETLARDYIRRGLCEFVEAEEGETKPTRKEMFAYNRALKADQTLTKGPQRREVKRRAVDPGAQKKG